MRKLIPFSLFLFLGCGLLLAQDLTFPVMPEKPKPVMNIPEREQPQIAFPEVPDQMLTFKVDRFDGGLNLFWPVDQSKIIQLLNFVPEGLYSLKKRSGKQKIYFTSRGANHGMAIGDSARAKPHLVVVANDSLYWADSSSSWELVSFGGTTAEPTYFTSTPFGLVISNDGSDSTRIWNGISLTGLGVCDTGTVDADSVYSADTVWVSDSSAVWATDEWIGYFLFFTSVDSLWKIIDNGSNWFLAISTDSADTDRAGDAFKIISQPDSMSSDLTYPKGQATAYYQDRLFVSSAYYPWRIWYSDVRLIDKIDFDAFKNLDLENHDQIQLMVVFNGYLIVFAKYSMYGIDRSLNVYPISKNLGCVAPKSVALGDNFIYWASVRGIYRMEGNIYGSLSYRPEKISDQINDIYDNIDPQNLENCGGVYTNRQYWFSYHPDSCLVFDERTNFWGRQTFGFTSTLKYSNVFNKTWNEILLPDADGDTTLWRLSAGTDHYTLIDDIDGDTDYVWTPQDDSLDFFTFGNTTQFPTGGLVQYITIYIRGCKYPYCSGDVNVDLIANQKRYNLGTIDLTGDWVTYQLQKTTNPVTSSLWTKGDLDSLELALVSDLNTGCTHRRVFISALRVVPYYYGNLTAGSFLFASPWTDYVYQYGGTATDDTSGDSTYNISGLPFTSTYQSGWFDLDLPVNQKIMRKFFVQLEKDAGNVKVYFYKNFETTPIDSATVSDSGKVTDLTWLPAHVAGKNFSIKIETTSNIDSLTIKGWSALLRDLGERKD